MALYKDSRFRKPEDKMARIAYENACDCHYWGESPSDWEDMGFTGKEREIIWNRAFWDVAEPDNKQLDWEAPIYPRNGMEGW